MAKYRSGPDLAARWARINEEVVTAATQSLFDAGVLVRDDAEKLTTVEPMTKSGRPRKGHKPGQLKHSYGVKLRHRENDPVVVIGTPVKSATYYMFAKDINGNEYGKDLDPPARALYKALDQNVDNILQLIAGGVAKGLDKVGGA
jgi:hypothetical protein